MPRWYTTISLAGLALVLGGMFFSGMNLKNMAVDCAIHSVTTRTPPSTACKAIIQVAKWDDPKIQDKVFSDPRFQKAVATEVIDMVSEAFVKAFNK